MEFVLPPVAWRFQHFMQKHRKWTSRLPLSTGCFLIAQAGIFYMLYYNSRALLRYNNSIYQAVIFFFKVSQKFIVHESAEDRNLRVIFNREKKCIILQYFYQIALQLECLTYLPKIDELASLDRLSSRELWKWYNSKGFGPATIWRGAAFHFLAFFWKMKIWLWISNMFHQRVLSDWKWSISKFQFWRRILSHTDSRS